MDEQRTEHESEARESDVIIEAREVTKFFGDFQALSGVTMDVRKGEVVVILGPSGSGKSSLMRCMAWIVKPDRGEVLLSGRELGSLRMTDLPMRLAWIAAAMPPEVPP